MKHSVTSAAKQDILHVNVRLRESKFKLVGVKNGFENQIMAFKDYIC